MQRQILNRWSGAVIWAGEAETVKDAIHAAFASDANLRGADLGGADLRDANLRGADLRGADLAPIRDDLYAVLSAAPLEVPALIAALKAGKVNGSTYSGDCACLVGTIANARGCEKDDLVTIEPDSDRPAERWFMNIHPGDTPEKSHVAKLTVEWVDEFLALAKAWR